MATDARTDRAYAALLARQRDLDARERAARHQAEQAERYGRPSAARDIRNAADRIRREAAR